MASEDPHPAPATVPGLAVRTVGDEAVVYDPATTATHALEPVAAAVLAAVDGRRDGAALADAASAALGRPLTTEATAAVVSSLTAAGLVTRGAPADADRTAGRIDRRTVLAAGAGASAAVLGGGIWSVLAPAPAAALSLGGSTTTLSTGFFYPYGVVVSADGATIYVADAANNRIAALDVASGTVTTLAGNGTPGFADGTGGSTGTAQFASPEGVALSPDGATLYVADSFNFRIRAVDLATGATTTVSGDGVYGDVDGTGGASGTTRFRQPIGLVVSPDGSTIYVADANNHRIRSVDVATGITNTLAGNGTAGYADGTGGRAGSAQFAQPSGIAVSPDGGTLYVVDSTNRRIRTVDVNTGDTATLTGSGVYGDADGTGGASGTTQLAFPFGVAIAPDGSVLYVADFEASRIRSVDVATGATSTLAGNGGSGLVDGTNGRTGTTQFNGPTGLAVSPDGSVVYVADSANNAVRAVS